MVSTVGACGPVSMLLFFGFMATMLSLEEAWKGQVQGVDESASKRCLWRRGQTRFRICFQECSTAWSSRLWLSVGFYQSWPGESARMQRKRRNQMELSAQQCFKLFSSLYSRPTRDPVVANRANTALRASCRIWRENKSLAWNEEAGAGGGLLIFSRGSKSCQSPPSGLDSGTYCMRSCYSLFFQRCILRQDCESIFVNKKESEKVSQSVSQSAALLSRLSLRPAGTE